MNQNAQDLMMSAPSEIDEQIKRIKFKINKKKINYFFLLNLF